MTAAEDIANAVAAVDGNAGTSHIGGITAAIEFSDAVVAVVYFDHGSAGIAGFVAASVDFGQCIAGQPYRLLLGKIRALQNFD